MGARGGWGLEDRTWGTGVEEVEEGRGDEREMETVALGLEEQDGDEEEGRGRGEEALGVWGWISIATVRSPAVMFGQR